MIKVDFHRDNFKLNGMECKQCSKPLAGYARFWCCGKCQYVFNKTEDS